MKLGSLLIIDDEVQLVKNVTFLLKDYAENIFNAFNGEEGLKILKEQSIQCVICDISMPKMTGVELIREVRNLGIEVPFVFYTAYGHSELMMEAAKYGAFDFLRKPDFEGLEEAVSRGVKEGFKRENKKTSSSQEIMTEYEKILQDISKL